jgi:inorganic triphosphatase YgiF
MHEIELKFQVPVDQRAALDRAVAGRTPRHRVRLQAAYCDTVQRTLAKARLALRVRREGRQWVQTLKGATGDGMTRLEHNVPRGSGAAVPVVDPALHSGTLAGDRLQAALDADAGKGLGVRYRTDILRRARVLRTALGNVELAFDTGWIKAGDAKLRVHELEFELLRGSPQAVIVVARRWLPRFGLWLDSRSKAECGDLLARGESMAPPREARRVQLAPGMSAGQALRQVLGSCADQIIANASQIASGEFADEHVHQLRVGLRRLRSALRLFAGTPVDPGLALAAAALFQRLGTARDQVVIEAGFTADLQAALDAAGVSGNVPHAAAAGDDDPPTATLRDPASQALLLDLLAATHAEDMPEPEPDPDPPLRDQLAARLSRWHRRAAAGAKHYRELDDAGRHRLRKQVKRLRYALEFSATLFRPGAVRRYLAALRAAQERLGEINDVVMAMDAYRRARDTDPRAWFALGWLAARRDVLIAQALPDLKAFGNAKPFWKGS